MWNALKGLERIAGEAASQASKPGVVDLAAKYGVPFDGSKFDAGCPGIMNPLGESPKIELRWGSGFNNEDKSMRFNQFSKTLEILDQYVGSHDNANLVNRFVGELNIHGRAMFCYIALHLQGQHEQFSAPILSAIEPRKSEGLNMAEIPFGKGGATVQQIFNHYIEPKLAPFHVEASAVVVHEDVAAAAANPRDDADDEAGIEGLPNHSAARQQGSDHGSALGSTDFSTTEGSQGEQV